MDTGNPENCWKTTGSAGDRTCPKLGEFIYCRNCPVFSDIGRSLLERPAPEGYLSEWTALLASQKELEDAEMASLVAFRLSGEWFALRTRALKEVVADRTIHTIPHRSNQVLLGIANVRGELLLCASLWNVLGIERAQNSKKGVYGRMLVIEHGAESWVFPVDEVDRVYRVSIAEMGAVPVTISKDGFAYSRAIVKAGEHSIAFLDEDLLFGALRRSLRWQTT
ncbi:MAG: chemotaxis protein CheW [Desulfobacteraceae bacterium]|nr:chemotaxis protein CheW [Desulfobacteraceae bacterium]